MLSPRAPRVSPSSPRGLFSPPPYEWIPPAIDPMKRQRILNLFQQKGRFYKADKILKAAQKEGILIEYWAAYYLDQLVSDGVLIREDREAGVFLARSE